jgi:hypothetical protein
MGQNALQTFVGGIRLAITKGGNHIGLRPSSAPATSYDIQVPSAPPSTTSLLQMASNGVVSFTTFETGLNKGAARAASTANITIATPGAAIDGVTLVSGDLVLLKDQTTASENGLYVFNGAAAALTRATSSDTSAEVLAGMSVFISEGTVNDNRTYQLTTNNPITLGTTALAFTQTGGTSSTTSIANGGTGATTAAAARTNLGAAGIFRRTMVNADLTAGILTVTHGLGQQFCQVQVYDEGNRCIQVLDEITCGSATSLTIDFTSFGTIPGTWNIVVIG